MRKLIYFMMLFGSMPLFAQKVVLDEMSATVWSQQQQIKGHIEGLAASSATLFLNGKGQNVTVAADSFTFSAQLKIGEGVNTVYVNADSSGKKAYSDTLKLTLGYKLRPDIYAYAEIQGRTVTLKSEVVENPDSAGLTYLWSEDELNPVTGVLTSQQGNTATFSMPQDAARGEYYFNLTVAASDGDTVKARTYVTVDSAGVKPFNIRTDHAAWIDRAVIYEITPYTFTESNQFKSITAKIPELAELGITAIWLQPVYRTHGGGMGYDVTDYFSLRGDLGSETDLRNLIKTAKANGLKVMFDFVANHTSIYHPYAQNSVKFKEKSHYWNYYQRKKSPAGTPYAMHENTADGLFWNYFWSELPNLNFDNPEVQRWILEAVKYWLIKYDLDGYRFDAIWGVTARKPEFTKQLRLVLKRIKPDCLLLAEDKATWPEVFDERFDAAFDWAASESWVSQWVWQTDYDPSKNPTIFNTTFTNGRSAPLRSSLNNNGKGYGQNAKILRFLENNDTYHFITHHSLDQTKMAAALEFSLNGIPMLYNGQEAGITGHAYDDYPIYSSGKSIKSTDKRGLFPYYQKLISFRKSVPALYGNNYEEESASPNKNVFAFRRWVNSQNIFTVLNMDSNPVTAQVNIPVAKLGLDSTKTYYMSDLISGKVISGKLSELAALKLYMVGYSASVMLLADTAMVVSGVDVASSSTVPESFAMQQNYPNPFNPSTTIRYTIDKSGPVSLRVYDILGKEVEVLNEGYKNAGNYTAVFNASRYASGIYICRLQAGGHALTMKMLLLK
ncbi:MAG: T9SS type A sorting domain-containing protein [Ignavibacteria bacterium]|jgi:glycosidase|nr:T9SS type A sorting domain-containing protein [Ignavibacteria bacterium]MCU7505008.1 T9SS type A sorting domain-containing protein [Ignavibacteria bacterium]MCU7514858.1 T9SS type A sorting domain-containing protein [Ignavibacteria bacterium]